jgi:hypothetical protein
VNETDTETINEEAVEVILEYLSQKRRRKKAEELEKTKSVKALDSAIAEHYGKGYDVKPDAQSIPS